MEFTMVELAALILIALWGLVAMGKMRQKLSAISRTLQEIKVVLQDGRDRRVEGGVGAAVVAGDAVGPPGTASALLRLFSFDSLCDGGFDLIHRNNIRKASIFLKHDAGSTRLFAHGNVLIRLK